MTSLQPQTQLPEPSVTEIREELRSLLASPRFRQSPRLAKLLRYLCTSALADEAERITEYTIALDVLGKAEDFKEGKDAIVRVEVHRLRKRLAEFYEEEGAAHRVRIVIPTGNYAPQFQRCETAEPEPPVHVTLPAPALAPTAWWRHRRYQAMAAAILALTAILPAYKMLRPDGTALDAFWGPVLASSHTVLLCIGNRAGADRHNAPPAPLSLKDYHEAPSELVHVADATTLARVASLIQSRGHQFRMVSQTEATYADLQSDPVVLIGLLNNEWTRRLVGQLRFTVERPGPGKVLLRDRDHPLNHDWFIDYYIPYLDVTRDYALVLRATDPKTEQMTVTAGGMSVFGTLAAGEFLTNPNEMRKLAAIAPRGWKNRNLEVVLSTEVIRGKPGPPSVVATHFW